MGGRLLPDPPLCLITDESVSGDRLAGLVEGACRAGCRWVQLRLRAATGAHLSWLARRLRLITRACSATLIVHDRADVALACDADGLHLPAAGMTPAAARRLIGSNRLLGRSVHGIEEIRRLKDEPIDYFQFGPVYDTPSKRRYGAPQGISRLADAVAAAGGIPVVAVGGIDSSRVGETLAAGAAGVAVIRALGGDRAGVEERTGRMITAIRAAQGAR